MVAQGRTKTSRSQLKKAIRSTKRLLGKQDLRAYKEGELAEMERQLKGIQHGVHANKYRKIRFVERKKVLRTIEKLEKQIVRMQKQNEDVTDITENLNISKQNLDYIDNFPSNMKYVSLFPVQDTKRTKRQRAEILTMIAQQKQAPEAPPVHLTPLDASADDEMMERLQQKNEIEDDEFFV